MSRYTIKLTVEASRIDGLRKKLAETFPDAAAQVEKINTATSRADRLSEAESSVEDAKSVTEELREELQNWRDSLPDNLQQSEKAGELDDCISCLETLESALDDAMSEFGNVEFPGMY